MSGGDATGDTLVGIEGLIGSEHDDVLTGDASSNALSGGPGDDLLTGLGGDDVLSGGKGADTVDCSAALGAVVVDLSLGTASGAEGEDALSGLENVLGSALDDQLTGTARPTSWPGATGTTCSSGTSGAMS